MPNSNRPVDIVQLSLKDTTVEFTSEGSERSFTMKAYSNQVVEHSWFGRMVFETAGFTMAKDVIPALFEHDGNQVVGEITSMKNENGEIVFFGNFIETPEAQKLLKAKNLKYECSMAFPMSLARFTEVPEGESVKVNNTKYEGPIRAIHAAPVLESSFAHYGAVSGTSTEFSNQFINKENTMDTPGKGGDAPTPQKSARDELNQMIELSGDSAFAAECFGKGIGLDQFRERIVVKLSEEKKTLTEANVKLATKVDELNGQIVELKQKLDDSVQGSGPPPAGDKDYLELSKEHAAKNGVSIREAMTFVANTHPDLYQKYTGRS